MLDLRRRVGAGRGQPRLQRLSARLPGFTGYASPAGRAEDDRLLRTHIAELLLAQRQRLADVQSGLVDANDLRRLPAVEAAMVRLQALADEIGAASYGDAGLLGQAQVDEAELNALYRYDLALYEGLGWLDANVRRLSEAIERREEPAFQAAADDLNATLDRLAEQMVARRDLVVAAKRPPVLSPQQLLAAAQIVLKPTPHVPQLQPGDLVSYAGQAYVVAGRADYHHAGKSWQSHLLQDGEERWLWSTDGGKRAYLASPVPPPQDMAGQRTIDWQGETLTCVEEGSATADIVGPAGRQSGIALAYWRLVGPSGRVLWLERQGEDMAAYLGEPVEPDELEFRQMQRLHR